MSLLEPLKKRNIPLPESEIPTENLLASEIINEIQSFYERLNKSSLDCADFAEGEHLNLISEYPESMCLRNINEKLGSIIALVYYDGFPAPEEIAEYDKAKREYAKSDSWERVDPGSPPEPVFSMDDLALIFNKSKSSIYEACRRYESQARQAVRNAQLRVMAHNQAMAELVREEKEKIKNEHTNQQTSEQTPLK